MAIGRFEDMAKNPSLPLAMAPCRDGRSAHCQHEAGRYSWTEGDVVTQYRTMRCCFCRIDVVEVWESRAPAGHGPHAPKELVRVK
jgi:hypothetical protein